MTVRTKDEKFILCLYSEAKRYVEVHKGCDLDEVAFDRYAVGVLAGLQPKGVEAIVQQLVRGNFVKKAGETEVSLAPHGIRLAERLLEE